MSAGDHVCTTIDADWANYSSAEMSGYFPSKAGLYEATIHMLAPLLNSDAYDFVVYLARGGEYLDWQRA